MSTRIALLALVACSSAANPRPASSDDSCDLKQPPEQPSPDPGVYVERELDADEMKLAETPACTIPDVEHGLEQDDELVTRCELLADKGAPARRSSCRHACIAVARARVASIAFANAVTGLDTVARVRERKDPQLDACMKSFGVNNKPEGFREVHDGRNLWACLGLPALPSTFILTVTHERAAIARLVELDLRGATTALPMHHWRVALEDHGCGVSSWSVSQLAPRR